MNETLTILVLVVAVLTVIQSVKTSKVVNHNRLVDARKRAKTLSVALKG